MKPSPLFVLNRSIACIATTSNPFRLASSASLSPFASIKEVNREPVRTTLVDDSLALKSYEGNEQVTKTETFMLRSASVALLCISMLCVFGVQQIAHNRKEARLGRLLQQKEKELVQMTQAYRGMQISVAMHSAQDMQKPAVLVAVVRQSVPSLGGGAQRRQTVGYARQTQKPGKVALSQSRSLALGKTTKSKTANRS